MKIILVSLCFLTTGCAIIPNSVRPEIEHMSHLTQHSPCTDHPTDYGANVANIVLHWDLPRRVTFELAEGVDLDRHWTKANSNGEIMGPREEFSARVGYVFTLR